MPRQVGATVNTVWTKGKANVAARAAGHTKQRARGRGRPPSGPSRSCQGSIADKALLAGSLAVQVEADQTSQCCLRCGQTAEDNRPHKGLLFVCQVCQLVLHADLVGARNVALRTLLARQDWVSTGVLSERPDVSDEEAKEEAKAVRRRRHAALRWSPDASPRAFAGGL